VRAAAAEAGRDREPLLDPRVPVRLDAGTRGDRFQRAAHEGVAPEAVHPQPERGIELDPVGQPESLVKGQELVLAVVAQGADDEREIDLRRRRSFHRSAAASATNSGGVRASARVAGSRPIAASATAARARVASPASSSEFGSVLRRCANAAPTSRFNSAYSGGRPRRRKATRADSTFGRGRNTGRETGW